MVFKLVLAVLALVGAVSIARWIEGGAYYDPIRGRRHCAAAAEVTRWSLNGRTRQAADRAGVEAWMQQHPEQLNQLFGPFCHSALHSAARFALPLTRGGDVNVRSEPREQTPLHVAAEYGHPAVAEELVSRGAVVDAATTFGRTPLHEAAFGLAGTSDVTGRVAIVRLLIARGADVNAREHGSGFTPLDQTTMGVGVSEEIRALLIAAGARPGTQGAR